MQYTIKSNVGHSPGDTKMKYLEKDAIHTCSIHMYINFYRLFSCSRNTFIPQERTLRIYTNRRCKCHCEMNANFDLYIIVNRQYFKPQNT